MPVIGSAPSGEDSSIDGTEKIPVTGSKWAYISSIAAYIRTLAQTLTNKTIDLTSNTLTGTKAQFNTAVSDGNIVYDAFKTVAVSGQSDVVADSDTDTLTLAAGSNITLTTNASTDTVTIAASGGNSFGTVSVSGQSDVVADAAPDTLTLAAGSNVTITTNAGTDTVTIAASGGNAFGTVAVSGQSDVVADAAPDTLTLASGSGITLTTNAGTDTVTIAASGGAFVLNTNTTPVGNVGSGEDNLITYSVPANTLDTNAQYIHFVMGGTFASSVNNKRIRVKLGSTTLFDTGALVISTAGDWNVEGYIVRTGSATQRCLVEFESNETALAGSADYVDATEDLTTTLVLKATGEATADDDVIQKFLIVEKGGGGTGGSGSVATDTIWDAKGDLAVATGADAAAKLTVGSATQVLVADADASTGVAWINIPLAIVSYNPNTETSTSTTSTTGADIDATNLTITFTAPKSGKVLVTLNACCYQSNSGVYYMWVLRTTGGSNVAGTKRQVTATTTVQRQTAHIYITGLTAGASTTYRWGHLVSANTGTTRYGDDGSTVAQAGAAMMQVWAVT